MIWRLAIARDEFALVYQPQKEVQSGTVTGFEALLRWKHPTRGEISPAIFYPDCRRDRPHPGDRRLGVKDSLPRGGSVDRTIDGRGQRSAVQLYNANFVQELHQILLETAVTAPSGDRDHRDGAGSRFHRALTTCG